MMGGISASAHGGSRLHHTRHRFFREAAGCRKALTALASAGFNTEKTFSAMVVQGIQKERNGSTLFSNPAGDVYLDDEMLERFESR